MAFRISSACFVGSGTQDVVGSLVLIVCGIGLEGPGCWELALRGRAWERTVQAFSPAARLQVSYTPLQPLPPSSLFSPSFLRKSHL